MGVSSGTRIVSWATIVLRASRPRSASLQYPSVLRGARLRALFPRARLSALVAAMSRNAGGGGGDGGGSGFGEMAAGTVVRAMVRIDEIRWSATLRGPAALAARRPAGRLAGCLPGWRAGVSGGHGSVTVTARAGRRPALANISLRW